MRKAVRPTVGGCVQEALPVRCDCVPPFHAGDRKGDLSCCPGSPPTVKETQKPSLAYSQVWGGQQISLLDYSSAVF